MAFADNDPCLAYDGNRMVVIMRQMIQQEVSLRKRAEERAKREDHIQPFIRLQHAQQHQTYKDNHHHHHMSRIFFSAFTLCYGSKTFIDSMFRFSNCVIAQHFELTVEIFTGCIRHCALNIVQNQKMLNSHVESRNVLPA